MAHLTALALLAGQAGRRLFGDLDGVAWSKTAIFVLVSATLVLAGATTKIPLLMGERFFPDSGSFWIVAFALYGAAIGGLLLGNRADRVRGRIWTLFSAVFFGQLALGLAGWSAFLMTGKLHLPVPALILAGPIYRGEGFFMLTLLAVSWPWSARPGAATSAISGPGTTVWPAGTLGGPKHCRPGPLDCVWPSSSRPF